MSDLRTHPRSAGENHGRPLRATVEADLGGPPEAVFDYLSRLENNPEWNWSVTATTALTAEPIRPGSRYLQASSVEPDDPQVLQLRRLERPHLLEVEATGSRGSVAYRYRLRASDGDTTRVTVHVEVRPRHPVGLPDLYIQRLQESLRANLETLDHVLTTSHPTAGRTAPGPSREEGR